MRKLDVWTPENFGWLENLQYTYQFSVEFICVNGGWRTYSDRANDPSFSVGVHMRNSDSAQNHDYHGMAAEPSRVPNRSSSAALAEHQPAGGQLWAIRTARIKQIACLNHVQSFN